VNAHDAVPASPAAAASRTGRTQVTLSRTEATDVGQREIFARIDDTPTRRFRFGDAWTEDVAPGAHQLRVNNTLFWKRVTFTIEPGEHIEFVLINRGGAFAIGMLALLGVAPLSLTIERRTRGPVDERS
jgi:hypothetical protein